MNAGAIVGVDPKTRICEIAASNNPENWEECRKHGYIVVPTTKEYARAMWGEVLIDIWDLKTESGPDSTTIEQIKDGKKSTENHRWKAVPVEPTIEMLQAMRTDSLCFYEDQQRSAYAEMLNVAPMFKQEPCGWQFFQNGKWHNGVDTHDQRKLTEAAGIPTRDVYPAQPAPTSELLEAALRLEARGWFRSSHCADAGVADDMKLMRAALAKQRAQALEHQDGTE